MAKRRSAMKKRKTRYTRKINHKTHRKASRKISRKRKSYRNKSTRKIMRGG